MRIHRLTVVVLLAALAVPRISWSATPFTFTISDGNASYTRYSFDPLTAGSHNETVSFTGVESSSFSELYDFDWWYRIAGDSAESPLEGEPDSVLTAGANSETLQWNDVDGRGLDVAENTTVYDLSTGLGHAGGVLDKLLLITNNSSTTPLSIDLFAYADVDLSEGSDVSAWREATNQLILEDRGPSDFVQLIVNGSGNTQVSQPLQDIHFGVDDYSNIWDGLLDSSVSDFSDATNPYGPGDFTAVYQIHLDIPPSGSKEVDVEVLSNVTYNCGSALGVYCDGFETSDTQIWSSVTP